MDKKEIYIKCLREYYERTGKVPKVNTLSSELGHGGKTIGRFFGGFEIALSEAGILDKKPKRLTPRVELPCLICGTVVKRRASKIKPTTFCSKNCQNEHRRRPHVHKKLRPCLHCGKYCKTSGKKFCSSKCSGAYQWHQNLIKIENDDLMKGHHVLRKYYLLTNNCCHECGLTNWRDKPLSLELDHIDGDGDNNRKSNTRLLCPNCHAQTPTYKYKNSKNPLGKECRQKRYKK